MFLKVIKEVKYGYDNILNTGTIVELIEECEDYYLIKTADNIKIKTTKNKVVKYE